MSTDDQNTAHWLRSAYLNEPATIPTPPGEALHLHIPATNSVITMRVIDRQIAFAVVGPFAILDEAEADQIADALHAAAQLIRGQHVIPAGTLEVGQVVELTATGTMTTTETINLARLIREAIATEWHKRIAEQTEATPDQHIDALTTAVTALLAQRIDGHAPPTGATP